MSVWEKIAGFRLNFGELGWEMKFGFNNFTFMKTTYIDTPIKIYLDYEILCT